MHSTVELFTCLSLSSQCAESPEDKTLLDLIMKVKVKVVSDSLQTIQSMEFSRPEKWRFNPMSDSEIIVSIYFFSLHNLFCTYTGSSACGSAGKESACSAGDPGSIPGLGRSPGELNGNPVQYSCLGESHRQRNLMGYIP